MYNEGNGEKTLEIYSEAVRYKDESGKLVDIDISITESSDKTHEYKNESSPVEVLLPNSFNK